MLFSQQLSLTRSSEANDLKVRDASLLLSGRTNRSVREGKMRVAGILT